MDVSVMSWLLVYTVGRNFEEPSRLYSEYAKDCTVTVQSFSLLLLEGHTAGACPNDRGVADTPHYHSHTSPRRSPCIS